MNQVVLKDELKRNFVLAALSHGGNPFRVRMESDVIVCSHPVLSRMLQRFDDNQTFIVPIIGKDGLVDWLILNQDYQTMNKHFSEVKNFLVPYYAEISFLESIKFDPAREGIGRYGAILFPEGYRCLKSPASQIENIFIKIQYWSQLDTLRPREMWRERDLISVYSLRSQFQQAIALKQWGHAKELLDSLEQGNFLSRDNCLFLKMQLYSAQGRWDEIWHSPDFVVIAGLDDLPAAVRNVLLTAFYQVVLGKIETSGDVSKTLQVFNENKNRLGTLLRYRAGLSGEAILKVFAYHAASSGSRDKLESFLQEIQTPSGQKELQELLNNMETVTVVPSLQLNMTPLEEAKRYFHEKAYDDAYLLLLDSPNSVKRVQLLLGVATITESTEVIAFATDAYKILSPDEQQEILNDPTTKGWVKFVLGYTEIHGRLEELPQSWEQWFQLLLTNGESQILENGLVFLRSQQVELTGGAFRSLSEYLFEIISSSTNATQDKLLKLALPDLTEVVLKDENFPDRFGLDLYEYLHSALIDFCSLNENNLQFILKLTEGLLKSDSETCYSLWPKIAHRFERPISRFAFHCLEALNLCFEYGLDANEILHVWNNWVGSLIQSFTGSMRTQVQAWRELGKAVGGDPHLLGMLAEILSIPLEFDPIQKLDSAVITIFSCREKPAKRAAEQIMERNLVVKVRVCTDDRLTEQAKKYAANSDLVIIATACISHALTYGISPYIRSEPIYPRSSGETGIVEALEEYCMKMEVFV